MSAPRIALLLGLFELSGCSSSVPPAGAPPPNAVPPTAAPDASHVSDASFLVSINEPNDTGSKTSACDGGAAENLTLGGIPTASDPGSEGEATPAAAFDDHTGTSWKQASGKSGWLAYELANQTPRVVTQYALTPAPEGTPNTDPRAFSLQGSNDGRQWTTLHVRDDQHFMNRQVTMWFAFENRVAFRRYRLLVTENGGGSGLQIAELQLFGPGSPVFSVDDEVIGTGLNQFHYSAGWEGHGTRDVDTLPRKYGRSSSWNKKPDESVSVDFNGSQIALFGVRYPGHGIAAISLDNGPEVMTDFFGPLSGNVLFFTSPKLCPPGQHSLRVRTTGQKSQSATDTFVSIDRVQITP